MGNIAGLTGDEAAEIDGIGLRTADQAWTFAGAWLSRKVGATPDPALTMSDPLGSWRRNKERAARGTDSRTDRRNLP
jgi:hypothetical protein